MEYHYRHIISVARKKIDSELERYFSGIKKDEERLKDDKSGKKEMDFASKLGDRLEIRRYKKKIEILSKLKKEFSNIEYTNISKIQFPESAKERLEELMGLLPKEEVDILQEATNKSMRVAKAEVKEKIEDFEKNARALVDELDIGQHTISLSERYNYDKNSVISVSSAITKIEYAMKQELGPTHVMFHPKKDENKSGLNFNEEILIDNIEKMINSKAFNDSKATKEFVSDFRRIKEALIERSKYSKIKFAANNIFSGLSSETGIDFTALRETLSKIVEEYGSKISKINKYLEKYDLASIEKQANEFVRKERENDAKKAEISQYEQVAYELEEMKAKHPEDYDKIREKEAELRAVARNSSMTNSDIEDAYREGSSKFHEKEKREQIEAEVAREKYAKTEALEKELALALRKEAIREIELSGGFAPDYEVKNGDVYDRTDREALIRRKMDELRKIAEMTPEQRGLQDLKNCGVISADATIDSLSPTKLNDIRIGYSDSSYEFMNSYKETKKAQKERANNIYREYALYRAGLEDKSVHLTFAEYAKQFYEIDGMTDELVDTSVKEQGSGFNR